MIRRVPELDGLRGIAIIAVLVHHLPLVPAGYDWSLLRAVAGFGWAGVDLFFVLSGFLIAGLLLDGVKPGQFYVRRAARILPLYVALLAGSVWASAAGFNGPGNIAGVELPLWPHALFVQNHWMDVACAHGSQWLGVTWSLAVEEQFYLVFPLLVWTLPRRALLAVLVGAMIAAPIARELHGGMQPPVLALLRADSLAAGAIVAVMTREAVAVAWLRRNASGALLAFAALILAAPRYSDLAILFAGTVLVAAMHTGSAWSAPLRWWPLRATGRISYGLYLLHVPALTLVLGVGSLPTSPAAGFTALVVVFVAAAASWRYFEKPALDFLPRAAQQVAVAARRARG